MMTWDEIMTTPQLTSEEYDEVVQKWNRRVRKGMAEPCPVHEWARVPGDSDSEPSMICVHCLRPYRPDPRMAKPARMQARPGDGRNGQPL